MLTVKLASPLQPYSSTNEVLGKNNISNFLLNIPESVVTQEPLVGSQKRKARKTKITHLVRTADGRVSPAGQGLGK